MRVSEGILPDYVHPFPEPVTILSLTTHNQWIIDSGATCHMCNEETSFSNYQTLDTPLNVILGDG